MPAASLLALIDDIASMLDDVSAMTKVAARKTAGVLGDDLALNAQQVSGVNADRELPVVWAVAKGSLVNKAILVPAALAISAFAPWAITPLLMAGGLFLCFEGFEKLVHRGGKGAAHRGADDPPAGGQRPSAPAVEIALAAASSPTAEREKVKGAVRTDFILSAEIIAITLGVVAGREFPQQLAVLAGVAVLMTVGVYGLVAGIVKLDDLGLAMARGRLALTRRLGLAIVTAAPWLMRGLSVAGTVAMFLVGGGILTHGWPALHHAIEQFTAGLSASIGGAAALVPTMADALVGVIAGAVVLMIVSLVQRALPGRRTEP